MKKEPGANILWGSSGVRFIRSAMRVLIHNPAVVIVILMLIGYQHAADTFGRSIGIPNIEFSLEWLFGEAFGSFLKWAVEKPIVVATLIPVVVVLQASLGFFSSGCMYYAVVGYSSPTRAAARATFSPKVVAMILFYTASFANWLILIAVPFLMISAWFFRVDQILCSVLALAVLGASFPLLIACNSMFAVILLTRNSTRRAFRYFCQWVRSRSSYTVHRFYLVRLGLEIILAAIAGGLVAFVDVPQWTVAAITAVLIMYPICFLRVSSMFVKLASLRDM